MTLKTTRDLKHRYAQPIIVPGGIPVDIDAAARRQHEAAMSSPVEATPQLVQILPVSDSLCHQPRLPRRPPQTITPQITSPQIPPPKTTPPKTIFPKTIPRPLRTTSHSRNLCRMLLFRFLSRTEKRFRSRQNYRQLVTSRLQIACRRAILVTEIVGALCEGPYPAALCVPGHCLR